jgi:hypothetical protein
MRTRYEVLIQSSEEAGFMYSGCLLLLCCDMYVKIYCMFLAVITSRFHTVQQELHLRTACIFRFDPAETVLVRFFGFTLITCLTSKGLSNIDKFIFLLRIFWHLLNSTGNRSDKTRIFSFHKSRKESSP